MIRSVSMSLPRIGTAVPPIWVILRSRSCFLSYSYSRTSTTLPFSAAAVTIAGLMSRVRPPGLPWRPIKLRFDDEAEISRPFSLSGFIARHIEQPASRHSKSGRLENLVESFLLGKLFDLGRTRNHQTREFPA